MSFAQEVAQLMPGIGPTGVASYKKIYTTKQGVQYFPGGGVIDGTLSRDPSNTVAGDEESVNDPSSISDITTLRAGLLMGKVTASKKYAPSVYGLTTAAVAGAQTSLSMAVATATEIVRRKGTTGTFKITGPAVTGGTVRTKTVTYSALSLSTGVATITALASAAVSAVNQVEALPVVDATGGSNTFTLTIEGITTAPITYSATYATLVTNINSALNSAFGASAIVASAGALSSLILTFSGTGASNYAARPITGHVTATLDAALAATGTTIGGATSTSTTTALGVVAVAADNGEFVSGSLLQPVDGSETIKTFLDQEDGIKVTLLGTGYDCAFPQVPVGGGVVYAAGLTNYSSADSAVQAWIKAALKAVGPFVFDDDV